MDKNIIAGGALAGLVLAGALAAQTAAEATELTKEQAIEVALLEIPGQVQEVELEDEDGMPVYAIETIKATGEEFEVKIAAGTGAVVKVEAEDDDDSM